MASSPDNLDDDQPQPVTHGQVHVPDHHPRRDELTRQLSDHLRQHIEHANTTADYGGHGTGFSSSGSFSPGGASGADYETTSVGDTPDADSQGPTGY